MLVAAGRGVLAPGMHGPSLGGSLLTGVPQTLGSPHHISTGPQLGRLAGSAPATEVKTGSPCRSATGALPGIAAIRAEEPPCSPAGDAAAFTSDPSYSSYPVPECHSVPGRSPWSLGRPLAGDQLARRDSVCLSLFRVKELWQASGKRRRDSHPQRKAEAVPGFEEGWDRRCGEGS